MFFSSPLGSLHVPLHTCCDTSPSLWNWGKDDFWTRYKKTRAIKLERDLGLAADEAQKKAIITRADSISMMLDLRVKHVVLQHFKDEMRQSGLLGSACPRRRRQGQGQEVCFLSVAFS